MNRDKLVLSLLAWFAQNARPLPWRATSDPYAVWVSEIMLQQTQVKTVVPYWERWMRALPDIRALARAKPERLHKLWEGLGYYTRVRNMHQAAQLILERHSGKFPTLFEDILELPGIGRYTAGAISSIAFHQPRPILDGNVIRVLTRLFGIAGDPRERSTNATLWRLSEELVHRAASIKSSVRASRNTYRLHHPVSAFNQSLMELGALVCTPRQPQCALCPVKQFCVAHRENRVNQLPNLHRRPQTTKRRVAAFVVRKAGRFLVRQRPSGAVNAHLWEFPNTDLAPRDADFKTAAHRALGFTPRTLERMVSIKHSITRYRITLDVFRTVLPRGIKLASWPGRWLTQTALRRLPFASAHKRILRLLS